MNLSNISLLRGALALAAAAVFAPAAQAASPGQPIDSDSLVNTIAEGEQTNPAVARDADGDSIVVWQGQVSDNYLERGIFMRRYDANGAPKSADVRVDGAVPGWLYADPVVAAAPGGSFVLVWRAIDPQADHSQLRARRYSAAGTPIGAEILVSHSGKKFSPKVVMLPSGAFTIAWSGDGAGDDLGIWFRSYSSTGSPLNNETRVNASTAGNQNSPSISASPDGRFVIAWSSYSANLDDVFAQRYDANRQPQGFNFRLHTNLVGMQRDAVVGMDAEGNFMAAWNDESGVYASLGGTVIGRRFAANGAPLTAEFVIPVTELGGYITQSPAIQCTLGGQCTVTWVAKASEYDYAIYARRIDAQGNGLGNESRVSQFQGATWDPAIAMDADGDVAITWWSRNPVEDPDGTSVRMRRLAGPEPVDLTVTVTEDAAVVPLNGAFNYTLKASNLHAPSPLTGIAGIDDAIGAATGLTFSQVMPAGVTYKGYSGTGWNCVYALGRLTCTRTGSPLRAGFDASVKILAQAGDQPAQIYNTANVKAHQYDPALSNNVDTETTTVQ